MPRPALQSASAGLKPLSTPLLRAFTTKSPLTCKARVGQILEQAQSALPEAYKTVKSTTDSNNADARRSQLIWLVKHSLGRNVDAAKHTPSPHGRVWDTRQLQDDGAKGNASWEGPTVWPHMW